MTIRDALKEVKRGTQGRTSPSTPSCWTGTTYLKEFMNQLAKIGNNGRVFYTTPDKLGSSIRHFASSKSRRRSSMASASFRDPPDARGHRAMRGPARVVASMQFEGRMNEQTGQQRYDRL
ncbi:MAG: hypothetical protein IPG47_17915 [Thermoflexaceae bacterium]|nr:hypothetical protein [Thermoflexaceae bacterium]